MKKTDYKKKLFFDFPELIYQRHVSRRQFIKVAGIGAFGAALSSPMFLGCKKEHVEQFVNWIAELPELINDYRKKNGQPEIKLSSKLSAVAMAHVRDLSTYLGSTFADLGSDLVAALPDASLNHPLDDVRHLLSAKAFALADVLDGATENQGC